MNEVEDEYGDDYFCSQQIRPIKKVYAEGLKNDIVSAGMLPKNNVEDKDDGK